jgi:hypothetical protein
MHLCRSGLVRAGTGIPLPTDSDRTRTTAFRSTFRAEEVGLESYRRFLGEPVVTPDPRRTSSSPNTPLKGIRFDVDDGSPKRADGAAPGHLLPETRCASCAPFVSTVGSESPLREAWMGRREELTMGPAHHPGMITEPNQSAVNSRVTDQHLRSPMFGDSAPRPGFQLGGALPN